ncbi:hypothetical protein ACRYKS_21715 [Escherichia coli]|uniref:hypothetical protein n=1 Tax=Escherichia coli TaxID=562 RepID=UPI001017C570|nr:hypothetical protein [Escherichia coli]QAY00500.1 structural protein [Escherichia phage Ecwhy_1]QXN76278.1 hypothetical protein [Escherichia phage BF17]VVY08041.1 Uncharacterised protein [Escherichia coli]HCJ9510176.1 hypothetical protein [Escherichia coli]
MSILNEMLDYNDEELNEARPYSRSQSAVDSAKGKVKGFFGSGQVEQGAQEVGAEANRLWAEFKRYVGRKYGKAQPSVPYADVAQFFKGNNLDIKHLGNNSRRTFTPKDVGSALLAAARDLMNDYRDDDKGEEQQRPAPQAQPDNAPQPAPQEQPKAQGSSIPDALQKLSPEQREQLLRMLS